MPHTSTETRETPLRPAKKLFRLLEPAYADLSIESIPDFFSNALLRTRSRFGDECSIRDHGLFERDSGAWAATGAAPAALGRALETLEREEIAQLHASGVVLREEPFPAAIWLLGARREWAAVLRLAAPPDEHQTLFLKILHMAIQQRAQQAAWHGMLDRAKAIQRSLLPEPFPELPGFDIAARSEAAEDVGGDVYDGIPLGRDTLGLLIADASGHGLPAALEARDVVIGMRMGAARDLKITATLERLNRILCDSTLASRFVSLVYGELHDDGAFEYVNAGHPAALVVTGDETASLIETGAVLGVLRGTRFRVGRAVIPPGGTLLLYTDGVTECPSPEGEEFGVARLGGMAQALARHPAAMLVTAIFDALAEHAGAPSFPDDASVLVARRRTS
jgi:serine phosphatase RsbU (regulator of sigma subunit)